ncbi:sensor histidine kinase [Pseudactinotalea suaedae]|uniref:sensor histidine kinase n=1 Tax=Pseudactinotalea suaedae TaxID=1524924 RepID=UPI0012E2883F|nr:sensor histidine kinase [Pseudactinotalea suaedae]
MTAPPTAEQWERWLSRLPFPTLAVATVIALAAAPAVGASTPSARLLAQIALVPVTALVMWWWTVRRPAGERSASTGRVYYGVRTALALALTLLNPLFCIFAWVGYIDAYDYFGRRGRWLALGVTAFIMAIGQSGGIPVGMSWHLALLVGLFGVNFLLAGVLSRYSSIVFESNERRAQEITELEALNDELELALAENARLQATVVAQARESGVQQERQRLAREIHDTIAQSLAGVLAQLQAAQEEAEPAAVKHRVDRAAALAREGLAEARRSVMDLVPAPLSAATLEDAISTLVSSWAARHEIRAEATVVGEARPLHPEVEATVLRIAQEALSNVGKHADAGRVAVTLTYDEDEVILDVRDDGVGFDPSHAAQPTSFGLRGMRQRADRLAGVLEVEAAPGAGTAVSARLPALGRSAA